MLALSAEQLLTYFATAASNNSTVERLMYWRFVASAFLPGVWLLFAATYSRGNLITRLKRRFLFILPCFVLPLFIVISEPNALGQFTRSPNAPYNWIIVLDLGGFLINAIFLLAMIGALLALERTFRASTGTMRWKIKFTLYGLTTLFAARFFTSSQTILAQESTPYLEAINAVALFGCCLLTGRSILRSGSFEIDLYPSKSIISGSVVLSIAGLYLVLVGILSNTIGQLGGEQAFAIQAFLMLVALVGLGLFIQADRTRQLLRQFVSRHFQRPLYDFRTLWLKVSELSSQSVHEVDICESTTKLITNLFDTKLTSIWLLDATNKCFRLVASSVHDTRQAGERNVITEADLPRRLIENPDPQSIENGQEEWKLSILKNNPSLFPDGGHRILVPLTGQGNAVGFIVLGDRTNTLKFIQQEFDTLSCISGHISATLLSAALTRKREESKEIEAFQTMATFFVHDLKNAVSTLNLMLKNMPLHWDNPEFREDALRGIGSTSQRITDLITRLSKVRHELDISPRQLCAKDLVEEVIQGCKIPDHVELKFGNLETSQISADHHKLSSVVLNLVINASEAIHKTGTIEVTVENDQTHALISVADTGAGMSQEFVQNSLFRPFRTTKKGGLGIGIFQSKLLVEAHGGTLNVQSEEGKGSIFTIRIPLIS